MNEILVRTWQLLSQNWILLGPVLIETVIMLVFTSGGGMGEGSAMSILALFFLHQALLGGWLYQMKIVLLQREPKTSLDDFFEGLARYFWPMLNGASVFFLLFMLLFMLGSLLSEAWFGPLDQGLIEKALPLVQNGNLEKLQSLMQTEAAKVLVFLQWAQVLVGAFTLLAIVAVVTSFWQQYCVLGQLTWWQAWKRSKNLIFKFPGKITYLGFLWLIPTVILQFFMLSGQAVLQILAMGLDLVVKTYFTLLFCQIVFDLDRESVTPLPEVQETPRL